MASYLQEKQYEWQRILIGNREARRRWNSSFHRLKKNRQPRVLCPAKLSCRNEEEIRCSQVKPNRGLSPVDVFSKHKGKARRNLDTSGRKSMGSSDTGRPAGYAPFRASSKSV